MTCIHVANTNIVEKQDSCSLHFKAGHSSTSTLFYVNYSKLTNNGNRLPLETRKKLEGDLNHISVIEDDLKAKVVRILSTCSQLVLEPTNDEVEILLEQQQSDVSFLLEKLEFYKTLEDNRRKRLNTKKNVDKYLLHWKIRRKLCVDFLTMLEECTDGSINVKKCLAGAGQVEIESDESVAKEAWDIALNRRSKRINGDVNASIHSCFSAEQRCKLVSVHLLPNGTINRVYFPL